MSVDWLFINCSVVFVHLQANYISLYFKTEVF